VDLRTADCRPVDADSQGEWPQSQREAPSARSPEPGEPPGPPPPPPPGEGTGRLQIGLGEVPWWGARHTQPVAARGEHAPGSRSLQSIVWPPSVGVAEYRTRLMPGHTTTLSSSGTTTTPAQLAGRAAGVSRPFSHHSLCARTAVPSMGTTLRHPCHVCYAMAGRSQHCGRAVG